MITCPCPGRHWWDRDDKRTGRVVLHPLAQVVVRMLVPVGVGRGQLVVHVLRDCERSNRQKKQDHGDGQAGPQSKPARMSSERSIH